MPCPANSSFSIQGGMEKPSGVSRAIHRLQILAPTIGDDHIANMQARIDTAGNSREHHRLEREAVERDLGVHRRIDHAHSAQEQDDILAGKLAQDEAAAIDLIFLRS